MKKDSFKKKLAAYIVMSEAFLLAHPLVADAQIMYTDVNPDLLIDNSFFNLDLNNDGVSDFQLKHSSVSLNSSTVNGGIDVFHQFENTIDTVDSNKVVTTTVTSGCIGYPSPLALNALIDSMQPLTGNNLLKFSFSHLVIPSTGSAFSSQSSVGCVFGTNKYIGLKLENNGNTYYGWARLNVQGYQITLKDYAVNLTPNASILAGEGTACTNTPTASPVGTHPLCDSLTIQLFNTNGIPVQWMKSGLWLNGETDSSITIHQPGRYQALVSDGSTCAVLVNADSLFKIPALTFSGLSEECNSANGVLSVSAYGGNIPYTYLWSNGGTANVINNISAGAYSVTVTDNDGCFNADSFLLMADPVPSVITETHVDSVCDADGSIDIMVSGGTLPYTYNWNNGFTTEDIANLFTGNYVVTVTNAGGCTSIKAVDINNYPLPAPTITLGGTTITVDQTFSSYQWEVNSNSISGATNQQLTAQQSGWYKVLVHDSNNCWSYSDSVYYLADAIQHVPQPELTVTVDGDRIILFHLADNSLMGSQIDILNGLGQLVATVTVTNQTPEADLSALPAGIYFYHICSKQKTYSGKFFIE